MQRYTEINPSEILANSLSLILDNDKTALSNSSGTAFPTINTQEGMACYREDHKKLYVLSNGEWKVVADLTGDSRLLDGGNGNAINYSDRDLDKWADMPTGFYEGRGMYHSPVQGGTFRVLQIRQGNSAGYATQIAFDAETGKSYVRNEIEGVWTNWEQIYTSNSGQVSEGMNADMLDDRHAGNQEGQIPISNKLINYGLNAEMLSSHKLGNESGKVPLSNKALCVDLNADKLDGLDAGNESGNIPISNGKLNKGLNAEMIGGVSIDRLMQIESNGDGVIETEATFSNLNVTNMTAKTIVADSINPKNFKGWVVNSYRSGETWYRKWSDGFIEQHGTCGNGGTQNFITPFLYQSTISLQGVPTSGGHPDDCYCVLSPASTSTFTVNAWRFGGVNWYACGY